MVFDDSSLHQVNGVLSDVGAEVGDTFQVFFRGGSGRCPKFAALPSPNFPNRIVTFDSLRREFRTPGNEIPAFAGLT